jgi:FAD binding domain
MRRDPVIIGAGPAGTAAAIMLARAGHQPILIERTAGPTDKVCGDFLSQDTIKRAQLLGVDPMALGAAPIHRVRLIHGQRAVDAALPFPALGLSRRMLDSALLRQAAKAGVILHTGQTVRRLTHDGNQWSILTDTFQRGATPVLIHRQVSQGVHQGVGYRCRPSGCPDHPNPPAPRRGRLIPARDSHPGPHAHLQAGGRTGGNRPWSAGLGRCDRFGEDRTRSLTSWPTSS